MNVNMFIWQQKIAAFIAFDVLMSRAYKKHDLKFI